MLMGSVISGFRSFAEKCAFALSQEPHLLWLGCPVEYARDRMICLLPKSRPELILSRLFEAFLTRYLLPLFSVCFCTTGHYNTFKFKDDTKTSSSEFF
jgi:hypothetical protein